MPGWVWFLLGVAAAVPLAGRAGIIWALANPAAWWPR